MNWHRTDDLWVEDERVVLRLQDDREVLGSMRLKGASGRDFYWLTSSGEARKIDRKAVPPLWRPARPEAWPATLPPTVATLSPPDWKSEPPLPGETYHAPVSNDSYPYPGLKLHSAPIKPKSERECEARILRAVRSFAVLFKDHPRRNPASWLREHLIAATAVEAHYRALNGVMSGLRPEDHDDLYLGGNELEAIPERWQPTPRDVSDAEWFDAGPLAWIVEAREIIYLRAALPPFSWTQIGERQKPKRFASSVKRSYEAAITKAFARSKRA